MKPKTTTTKQKQGNKSQKPTNQKRKPKQPQGKKKEKISKQNLLLPEFSMTLFVFKTGLERTQLINFGECVWEAWTL